MRALALAALLAAAPLAAAAQAPADDLAQGVELRRAGRLAESVPPLERATRANPGDADAWLNLGLSLAALRRFEAAEQALDRAAALSPGYLDVQIARARLSYFRGDRAEARRRLAPVLTAQPANAEAVELQGRLAEPYDTVQWRWRVDAAHSHGFLSGGLPDQRSTVLALARGFLDGGSGAVSVEHVRQFGRTDLYTEATLATRRAYLAVGATPDADFRPELSVRAGFYAPAWRRGAAVLQPVVEGRWARYAPGEVWSANVGADLDISGTWGLSGRFIFVHDELGRDRTGYIGQARWRPADPLGFTLGFGRAPESTDGVTVMVKSESFGVAWDLDPYTTLRLTGAQERRRAYDRNDLTVGATRRF